MGTVFNVAYVRRPTISDARWVAVAVAIQVAIVAAGTVICRLVTGAWWHPFLWVLPISAVVNIAWGLRDRTLARRQFDRQETT